MAGKKKSKVRWIARFKRNYLRQIWLAGLGSPEGQTASVVWRVCERRWQRYSSCPMDAVARGFRPPPRNTRPWNKVARSSLSSLRA